MATNDANETKLAQPEESETGGSRKSLDISDDTYRKAKALAAIHGEKISQFFETAALERIARLQAGKPSVTARAAVDALRKDTKTSK